MQEKEGPPSLKRENSSQFMRISSPDLLRSVFSFLHKSHRPVISSECGNSQVSPDSSKYREYLIACLPPSNWITFPGATLLNHRVIRWLLIRKHKQLLVSKDAVVFGHTPDLTFSNNSRLSEGAQQQNRHQWEIGMHSDSGFGKGTKTKPSTLCHFSLSNNQYARNQALTAQQNCESQLSIYH